jgi:hypothetical protein
MSQQEVVRVVAPSSRLATPVSKVPQRTYPIVDKLSTSPLTMKVHVNRSASRLAIRDPAELVVLVSQRRRRRPDEPTP